jgi:hypothetical protein
MLPAVLFIYAEIVNIKLKDWRLDIVPAVIDDPCKHVSPDAAILLEDEYRTAVIRKELQQLLSGVLGSDVKQIRPDDVMHHIDLLQQFKYPADILLLRSSDHVVLPAFQ